MGFGTHIILGEKYDEDNDLSQDKEFSNQNVISLPLKNARKVFEKHYLQYWYLLLRDIQCLLEFL